LNVADIKGLIKSLDVSRKAFVTSGYDDTSLRSTDDAKLIIETLIVIFEKSKELFKQFPSLEGIFDKEFGPFEDTFHRESVLEIAFIEDFLFPDKQEYIIEIEGEFNPKVLEAYHTSFSDWCSLKVEFHQKTQTLIKENFHLKLNQGSLDCQCQICVGDFRAKIRDVAFKEQRENIAKLEQKLNEKIVSHTINQVSEEFSHYRKKMDKALVSLRHRLKRGSLKKLDSELKDLFEEKFSMHSPIGKVYLEKIKSFFNHILIEEGLKPGIIKDGEYERFFKQLGNGFWRSEKYLEREFKKLLKSVLALKRKDISATILRDYLGQFWMHSQARRLNRKIIYHMGPTNSGKTYHAINALCESKSGCYLAPLRLLASELYDTMNEKGVKTTLLTGEEVVETDGATHYSSTIEMAKLNEEFDCCVIDEIQMIADPQRGWAWTRALVDLNSPEIHLCGDPSVLERVKEILTLTGDTLEIKEYNRMTELQIMDKQITLSSLSKSDALICFSRRNALKYKADLEQLGFKVSIVYGRLSPEVRREQARKFDEGETDIMVSTDAIAMGMNLPVKRIVFSTLSKFINSKEFVITPSEIKQIAGRAGRYKRFPTGFVTTLSRVENGLTTVRNALEMKLNQKNQVMVGPDLEIYNRVNDALEENNLSGLSLSEFLRLFNTMSFQKPFYCVDLKEMIELAEMVEEADENGVLSTAEVFGFTCAPVNLGLVDHVQYYVWILNHYVYSRPIENEDIDSTSDNIDYLETAIKCVELYQWLARHFANKNFSFEEKELLQNKTDAIERLNELLSEKTQRHCSSCGVTLPEKHEFNICEGCFKERRHSYKRKPRIERGSRSGSGTKKKPSGPPRRGKKKSSKKKTKSNAFRKHR
jgi:ATP-dependent RNA helicase SUPV3L1/SUV3